MYTQFSTVWEKQTASTYSDRIGPLNGAVAIVATIKAMVALKGTTHLFLAVPSADAEIMLQMMRGRVQLSQWYKKHSFIIIMHTGITYGAGVKQIFVANFAIDCKLYFPYHFNDVWIYIAEAAMAVNRWGWLVAATTTMASHKPHAFIECFAQSSFIFFVSFCSLLACTQYVCFVYNIHCFPLIIHSRISPQVTHFSTQSGESE